MFNQLGWPELAVILLLALFVFGPERLPGIAQEAGRGLRQLRQYLRGMTDDLKTELGPEVGDLDLASLHPKTFVKKHLWDDEQDDDDDLVDQLSGRPRGSVPLAPGETPPWDPDTT
ncbi:MAG TPA: sec-independent translocase [Mycobacteriales bacterium]|nr:sec-independent translocase [Mycobacteriales bacterium]